MSSHPVATSHLQATKRGEEVDEAGNETAPRNKHFREMHEEANAMSAKGDALSNGNLTFAGIPIEVPGNATDRLAAREKLFDVLAKRVDGILGHALGVNGSASSPSAAAAAAAAAAVSRLLSAQDARRSLRRHPCLRHLQVSAGNLSNASHGRWKWIKC